MPGRVGSTGRMPQGGPPKPSGGCSAPPGMPSLTPGQPLPLGVPGRGDTAIAFLLQQRSWPRLPELTCETEISTHQPGLETWLHLHFQPDKVS